MKQTLLVLEDWKIHMRGDWDVIDEQAVKSLRQAIEEAEKQEPVAWEDMAFARLGVVRDKMHPNDVATVQKFLDGDYTHSKREWVGLTDEEIDKYLGEEWVGYSSYHDCFKNVMRWQEAKLKEKNGL